MARSRCGSAAALLALGIGVVAVWTWRSTRPASADGRQEIVVWNGVDLGDGLYPVLHQFELDHPQYKVTASSATSPDVVGDSQRLLCATAGGVRRTWCSSTGSPSVSGPGAAR